MPSITLTPQLKHLKCLYAGVMAGTLAKNYFVLDYGQKNSGSSARTDNKSKSIEERLPKIKRFHWWTQYQMALEEP